jgi:hypothetical protein
VPKTGLAVVFALVAASAQAQSAYVAGTIGADVSRFNRVESNLQPSTSADSDVVSGSLRVGAAVAQGWGVELEFVRSGRSHSQLPISILPFLAGALPSNIPVPIGGFQTDVRRSHSDFDGVLWARQRVGDKIDLVYLGGVAFSRERVEISQTFPTLGVIFAPVPGGVFRTTMINYGTRPMVGAEARIGLTSHVRLLPGLRVQGLAGGWLMRPYAGIGWFF